MTSTGLLAGFLLAAAIICVTPGPDMLYVASYGIAQGWRGGIAAAVGIAAGMSVHTVLAALGLSILIAHSPLAFTALKVIGACYLVYLGIHMIKSPSMLPVQQERGPVRSYRRITGHATVVNLLNPKIIIFYVAFLPQFVQRHAAPYYLQMLILGGLFVMMGLAADATVGIFSGRLSERITTDAKVARRIGLGCGIILCLLAAALLLGI